jgi:DNA-binding MarR family transcriptional regulator
VQLHSYIDCMGTPSGPRLCYALAARKSARYLSRLYGSHLAPAGLTVSQFSILGLLGVHGRLKITELADMLIMERTSLVRALKPLQAAGWVVAERSDNGRAFDVTLSPSGLEKFAEAKPLWAEAQAAFEGEVGRDRAIRFRDEILELNLGG